MGRTKLRDDEKKPAKKHGGSEQRKRDFEKKLKAVEIL